MNIRAASRCRSAAGAVAAAVLVGGCAVAPHADHFNVPPPGTTLTYQLRNSGSFGAGDSRMVMTVGETTWQGKRAVTYAREKSTTDVQDYVTHKMLATLGPDGKPAMTYDPPFGYALPFEIGKSWVGKTTVNVAGGKAIPFEARSTIEAYESVTVPAGTFKAWRIRIVNANGEEQVVWTSTDDGFAVKRSFTRPVSHPEGAGTREVELVSRRPG